LEYPSQSQPGAENREKDIGPFGFAEYNLADQSECHQVSPDLPFAEAAFLEPLATVIRGVKRLRVRPGENVLVVGAGTMGLLNAQVARFFGANVLVSELLEKKLQTAQELGFPVVNANSNSFAEIVASHSAGRGLDAIVIAVGANKAYQQAFKAAPMLCRVLVFAAGYPVPQLDISPNTIHYKEWELIGTYGATYKDFSQSAQWLSSGSIQVTPLLEKRYPLNQIQDAYAAAATEGAFRVTVEL